jgi:hypothetical protein
MREIAPPHQLNRWHVPTSNSMTEINEALIVDVVAAVLWWVGVGMAGQERKNKDA